MWVYITIALVVIFFVGMARGGGAKYIHVPDGESWRSVYREKILEPRKNGPNPASKTLAGIGIGMVVIAVLIVLYIR